MQIKNRSQFDAALFINKTLTQLKMKKIFFLILILFLTLPVIGNSSIGHDANIDLWKEILQNLASESNTDLNDILERNREDLSYPDDSTILSIIHTIIQPPRHCDIESLIVLENHGIYLKETNIGNPFHFLGIIEDTNDAIKCIDTLIKAGFDINFKDSDGKTAIIQNLYQQHPDTLTILKEMIRNGADPTIRSNKGLDLLHHALLVQLVYTELLPANSTEEKIESFSSWVAEYIDILKQVNFLYTDYYQNQ
ncbi:MAG: hypothetical protein ACK4L8_15990 [Nitrincola lacisaponensis]|uniref:hypothetical protein n=1 Tax=Nitrincola lacisaponensis TaxID=267850 RepID=UPI00391B1F2B